MKFFGVGRREPRDTLLQSIRVELPVICKSALTFIRDMTGVECRLRRPGGRTPPPFSSPEKQKVTVVHVVVAEY